MTTPSTTVLVDGVSDDPPTSVATSVDSEDDPLTPIATQRHRLELLTGPQLRHEQQYASADSFNASLDQLNRGDSRDGLQGQVPTDQHRDYGPHHSSITHLVDGDHHSTRSPVHEPHSQPPRPQNHDPSASPQQPSHPNQTPDGSSSLPHPDPAAQPSTAHQPPSAPTHPTTEPSPPPSSQRTNTSNRHQHQRRRRIVRWLRHRIEHPLPRSLDLRRRMENIQRRIRNVDNVMR